MEQLSKIRDEIRQDILLLRHETREDIEGVHKKLNGLSREFTEVKVEVAVHKSKMGTISTGIALFVSSITAWIVAHLTSNGGV